MSLFINAEKQRGSGNPEDVSAGCGGRTCMTGDRTRVTKKLARIMLDGKIPAGVRDRLVLPFLGKEALWIPGIRMGDSCKVTPETVRILEIHWNSAAFS